MVGLRGAAMLLALVLAGCMSGNAPPTSPTPSGSAASVWQSSSVVSLDESAVFPSADVQWLGDGSVRNLEPVLAVDPLDAKHLLLTWTWRDRISSLAGASGGTSAEVLAAQTFDGGETWDVTVLHDPALAPLAGTYPDAYDERAVFLPDGTAVVIYIGESQRYSATVAPADRITMAFSKSGAPWSYRVFATTATEKWDYAGLAVAPDTGHIYVATSAFYANTIQFWRSADQGATWTGPIDPFNPMAGGPQGPNPPAVALLKNPSIAAFAGGLVVVSAYSGLISQSDLRTTSGQVSVASHDDARTFGPPRLVPAGANGYLVTQSIGSSPTGKLVRTVTSDAQGAILFTESDNGGDRWNELIPIGQNGASKPYWAVFESSATQALETLVRSGDAATPWRISLFCREAGGVSRAYELAQARRMPPGPALTGGNQSDDYGGIAIVPDGFVYVAFADPRDAIGARIAIIRLQGLPKV